MGILSCKIVAVKVELAAVVIVLFHYKCAFYMHNTLQIECIEQKANGLRITISILNLMTYIEIQTHINRFTK